VRLSPTPEQWDPAPEFIDKTVDGATQTIRVDQRYSQFQFTFSIVAQAEGEGIRLSVLLDRPLPRSLEGKAGFHLEFLPSAYFGKTYLADDRPGIFPAYPGGPMQYDSDGQIQAMPIARGKTLVFAPEDPSTHVTITTAEGELSLYDGRNKAQNGWYVVRMPLPAQKTGTVVSWLITPHTVDGWTRTPVVSHSQVGYHPNREKIAVIELDENDVSRSDVRLLQVSADGKTIERLKATPRDWGSYLRYRYLTFDFSAVRESGLYVLEYGDVRTSAFPIASNVYEDIWKPTLDVFFPVQMDHMLVNEAYRVWHGASHLDDALQAPVDHVHFDLYAQGPTTDTRFKPGEHIPGLNVGGWYDAGDFDIRTQTQYATVLNLVSTWEEFDVRRDETTVHQSTRYVDIHHPDGTPDMLQQIEHGVLQLLAQHRAVGHAIHGIVEAHLSQYTHLGDAVTKTDNLPYDPSLDSLEWKGGRSGTFDDRWAFTTRASALNYGSIAALAAASRALRGYNDRLATECLETARRTWITEHRDGPFLYRHGNTTGGPLEDEELRAAVELLVTTRDAIYAKRIEELWPHVEQHFGRTAATVVRAIDHLRPSNRSKLESLVRTFARTIEESQRQNPFGMPITTGGWGGSGLVAGMSATNYRLYKAFPELIDPEFTLRGLAYLHGRHPGSNTSFVSGVGVRSKLIAYGNNRADYSYIAGGVVPGIVVLPPDFPENKDDWPFLWGENEYVINLAATYIYLSHAAIDIVKGRNE
jgi:hypothetical protein